MVIEAQRYLKHSAAISFLGDRSLLSRLGLGITEIGVEDIFRAGLGRHSGMGKEPNWRKGEQFARLRRDGDIEVREDGFSTSGCIQINERSHESPGRHLGHNVHVQREEITAVGEIALYPQLLK